MTATPPLTAHADVATEAPERYAKQLASHLGRKCEVLEEPDGTVLVLGGGRCLLAPGDGVLALRAQAPGTSELEVVCDVVGRHLERFGQRNELVVTWVRD